MSTTTFATAVCVAGELRAGDMLLNPSSVHFGVFEVRDVIECTDVDTDEEHVLVVFDHGGCMTFGYGDLLTVVTG